MTLIERDGAVQSSEADLPPRVWWISPVFISLFIGVASLVPTLLISDSVYRRLWRSPKSVTDDTILLFACAAAALAFGALIAIAAGPTVRRLSAPWPAFSDATVHLLRRASTVLTTLTLAGYAGFGALFLRAGLNPFDLVSGYGAGVQVRDVIGTIPGVTTLTQVGIAAVVISSVTLVSDFSRAELAKLLIVLGLATSRAFVLSERLAILELVVPMTVVLAAKLATARGVRRSLVSIIPVGSFLLVVVVFGAFEYFRSWTFYREHTSSSYTEFALTRFAGYYTTAINNGHLVYTHLTWPNRLPYDTVEAFWVAPGVEQMDLYEGLGGHVAPYQRGIAPSLYDTVLTNFGNPEFNNQSGYVGPFVDYGPWGGILAFLLIGVVAGFLYRGFRNGGPFGLFLYPVIFLGLLELPRYFYWSQGRATYAWISLIAVAVLVSRSEAKERRQSALSATSEKS